MNNESGLAPTICEDCETVFYGGVNAYLCPRCMKKRLAEYADEQQKTRSAIYGIDFDKRPKKRR
jgi:Zn finger protein HypA/HybF involved in hydrogenase expression